MLSQNLLVSLFAISTVDGTDLSFQVVRINRRAINDFFIDLNEARTEVGTGKDFDEPNIAHIDRLSCYSTQPRTENRERPIKTTLCFFTRRAAPGLMGRLFMLQLSRDIILFLRRAAAT